MKKKWVFIIVLVVIIVAVILTIVFINLFTAKTTKDLAETVYSVTQNGYLNENNEKTLAIEDYLSDLSVNSELSSEQKTTINNYANVLSAYQVAGEFFNRQIVFSSYTSVYKSNRKTIKSNFNKAQDAVDSLYSYLQTNLDKVSPSGYWLAETWTDCEEYVVEIIEYTIDAFTKLEEVYQSCVDSEFMNNSMSTIIFEQMDRYATIILNEEDENYSTAGASLYTFVNQYLTDEELILDYVYDADGIKTKADDILEKGEESAYYNSFLSGASAFRSAVVVEESVSGSEIVGEAV